MKNILRALFFLACYNIFAQSPGDILFVGYNASGDDDLSIVTMEVIPKNTVIYFTDNEPNENGNGYSGTEGVLKWTSGDNDIISGTVVVFSNLDHPDNINFGSSIGELTVEKLGFNISTNGDVVYATYGNPMNNSVTTWISAIQNSAFQVEDNFHLTGLIKNENYMVIDNSVSKAGGQYNGPRSGQTKDDYKNLIIDEENWYTGVWNGENILPFNLASFSFLKEADILVGDEIVITTENNTIITDRGTITIIYNMLGQEVINGNLNDGIYIVQIAYKNDLKTFKVLVK